MTSGLAQKRGMVILETGGFNSPRQKAVLSPETELINRIITTAAFTRSALLTKFLLYICDRKFSGRDGEITEYQIGVHALGRPDSYNPGEDNIVRNYARILRKRLEEYFAGEGRLESLRVSIPVGHYVPIFEPNLPVASTVSSDNQDLAASTPALNSEPDAQVAKILRWRRWRLVWIPAGGLFIAAIAVLSYHQVHRTAPKNINQVFWEEVFNHSRATYLVPGDSGLAMMQEITGKEVHLSDYIAGDLDEKFHDFNLAAARKGMEYGFDRVSNFTSKADLSIATRMAEFAQLYGGQLKVCYSRYMNMENFNGSNVILVGGPRANPWVEMFEPESNFRMIFPERADGIHFDPRDFINKNPRAGEQANYISQSDGTPSRTYALISFLPEPAGSGHALLLQGQGMAGTQAAGDFLSDPHEMEPILKKAQIAGGSIGPFEVLIEARTVGNNEVQSRVVLERFGIAKNSE
jgi:hypothetical protein